MSDKDANIAFMNALNALTNLKTDNTLRDILLTAHKISLVTLAGPEHRKATIERLFKE